MELKCHPKDTAATAGQNKSGNIAFIVVFEGQADHEKEETDINQTEHRNTIIPELEGRLSINFINYMKSCVDALPTLRKASMKMCLVSSTIISDNQQAIIVSSVAFAWNHSLTGPCFHSSSEPFRDA
jgi:hypothetical protein